jgi:hypothetical protein
MLMLGAGLLWAMQCPAASKVEKVKQDCLAGDAAACTQLEDLAASRKAGDKDRVIAIAVIRNPAKLRLIASESINKKKVYGAATARLTELESELWTAATTANTADSYRRFLTEFPKSVRSEKAYEWFWGDASRTNTVDAYRQFLKEFPTSRRVPEAQSQLAAIDWEKAKQTNTRAGYVAFYNAHKSSPFAWKHEAEILAGLDSADWNDAKKQDTYAAYAEYLGLPNDRAKHHDEARSRQAELLKSTPDLSAPELEAIRKKVLAIAAPLTMKELYDSCNKAKPAGGGGLSMNTGFSGGNSFTTEIAVGGNRITYVAKPRPEGSDSVLAVGLAGDQVEIRSVKGTVQASWLISGFPKDVVKIAAVLRQFQSSASGDDLPFWEIWLPNADGSVVLHALRIGGTWKNMLAK